MMGTFDSHYDMEMKEWICPVYNNNKYINGQMVMLLMAIKTFTGNKIRVPYGTYGIYSPVCYRAIFPRRNGTSVPYATHNIDMPVLYDE